MKDTGMSDSQKRVLFVCMGNICRSPAAEGVLRHLAAEEGLDGELDIDSAGTIGYHAGDPADQRMCDAARSRGIVLEGEARQFKPRDAETFDLVVAMDRENLAEIVNACGGRPPNLRLFADFLDDDAPRDVPDPYYGGTRGFEKVLDLLEAGCPRILDELLGEPPAGDRG